MDKRLAALSLDFRRISYWLYQGRFSLARQFLQNHQVLVKNINFRFGRSTFQKELKTILAKEENHLRAAERALTCSRLLWYRALKH